MKKGYWSYAFGGLGGKAIAIVMVAFLLIYLAGFRYPEVNNLIELKVLTYILVPILLLFFIGNYVAWKKR